MLELKGIYKTFNPGSVNEKRALNGIDLTLEDGDFVTIIGGNGAGKSTTISIMCGTLLKDGGKVYIDGIDTDVNGEDLKSKIGVVFQNPDNQFIGATVEDDIAFGLENHLIPTNEMQPIIEEYAKKTGMIDFLDKEPIKLSGGQKQRVAIAGVLAMQPEIIILDEATSMLDPKGKREIKELIKKMRNIVPNITIVSITHDISEAVASDKVIVMNKGKIFATGTPKEIFLDEDKLWEVGLQLPFTYKVQHELLKEGYSLELVMSTKEMVKEICQLNFKK
ncbi:MAG: energy-coupling factor transporter ATPase [Anaerotignum sp.]|nr:energy-coupling factor transporter ATPase [Anaerotignum sp.]